MKKEFLKIGIALLLLIGLAIPLSLHREKKINEAVTEEDNKKLMPLSMEAIQKIKFINKSGEVVLERRVKDKDGKFLDEFENRSLEFRDPRNWLVTSPYRALADTMVIDGFLNQIHLLTSQKTIQENKEQKTQYNLDPPILSIDLYSDGVDPKLTISMGSENPSSTGFYFMTSDKPGIYLGDRILQPYQNQPIQDWMEKTFIGFANQANVEKIQANHFLKKEDSFVATKSDNFWRIGDAKDDLLGDSAKINSFLSYITDIRSDEVSEDTNKIKNAKLIGEVSVVLKEKKEPIVYKIFDHPPRYFLQRTDLKKIYTIAEDPKIIPAFQDMIAKKLMTKSLGDLDSMKIQFGKNQYDLAKENNEWLVLNPYHDVANARRLDSIIQLLQSVEPKQYLKRKILEDKSKKITFDMIFSDKNKTIISLYQNVQGSFAKIEDGHKARVIEISQIPSELYDHLGHIRSDSIIPFTNENLKRIIFKKGNSSINIELSGGKKKQWIVNSLDNLPSSVTMKWKEELTAEELYERISEIYLAEFIDHPDLNVKYDTASLEIDSVDGKSVHWNFGNIHHQMIDLFSPERKVVGKIPLYKYNEIVEFMEEPKK